MIFIYVLIGFVTMILQSQENIIESKSGNRQQWSTVAKEKLRETTTVQCPSHAFLYITEGWSYLTFRKGEVGKSSKILCLFKAL